MHESCPLVISPTWNVGLLCENAGLLCENIGLFYRKKGRAVHRRRWKSDCCLWKNAIWKTTLFHVEFDGNHVTHVSHVWMSLIKLTNTWCHMYKRATREYVMSHLNEFCLLAVAEKTVILGVSNENSSWHTICINVSAGGGYRVAKTHRIPHLYRSLSAKETLI